MTSDYHYRSERISSQATDGFLDWRQAHLTMQSPLHNTIHKIKIYHNTQHGYNSIVNPRPACMSKFLSKCNLTYLTLIKKLTSGPQLPYTSGHVEFVNDGTVFGISWFVLQSLPKLTMYQPMHALEGKIEISKSVIILSSTAGVKSWYTKSMWKLTQLTTLFTTITDLFHVTIAPWDRWLTHAVVQPISNLCESHYI